MSEPSRDDAPTPGLAAYLGTLLVLALLALLLLWRGIAFGKLRDPPAHTRRSFADHVRAIGMQYARADASRHALGAYARWAIERLRERVPRGRHRSLDELAQEIPVGFVGDADDFGSVVTFLCSAQARFVTGVSVLVDGGAYRGVG